MLPAFLDSNIIEVGVDEAGRGCYAGPVFAAAVILPKDFFNESINDSKQLNHKQRNELRPIIETQSIAYAVAMVTPREIDKINILQASYKAMHLALNQLKLLPEMILVDGNRFKKYKNIPHQCIIKGDGKIASIAAASILAKTYRDDYMENLHSKFPHYDWINNKGYGTLVHRNAIRDFGICIHHRKSFNIIPKQMDLFQLTP